MASTIRRQVFETSFESRPIRSLHDGVVCQQSGLSKRDARPSDLRTGPQKTEPRPRKKKRQKAAEAGSTGGDGALRFFVVEHPDQLRDRTQMKQNRRHVMHNYLDKEAKKPESTDIRVRKHVRHAEARVPDITSKYSATGRPTPPNSTASDESPADTSELEIGRRTARVKRMLKINQDLEPLVEGIGGRYDYADYMLSSWQDLPFSPRGNPIGQRLEPFASWPAFDDPTIHVEELKFSCSQRFGSKSLAMYWIPTMLKARHAFLSTLCISSAYDDIMRRALLPHDSKTTESLMRRIRVRMGVMALINESISDPEMASADETIVAVLHVLHSEMMGCDDNSMRIHQAGLHQLVQQRGGLNQLGLSGQLAACAAITMFVLGALRETPPHADFLDYAERQNTSSFVSTERFPESPMCCRPTGFCVINKVLVGQAATYALLELSRKLVISQQVSSETAICELDAPTTRQVTPVETLSDLCNQIFQAPSGLELQFDEMNERYVYESIRIAAITCAHAAQQRLPLSQAAMELSRRQSRPSYVNLPKASIPLPIMLKHTLMRTNTSDCWGHLAGVLFWVTMVGGAAANPGPLANEEREGQDEDARKWITAVAVRCCIVLGFEHGMAVLEMLKRLVQFEGYLSGS